MVHLLAPPGLISGPAEPQDRQLAGTIAGRFLASFPGHFQLSRVAAMPLYLEEKKNGTRAQHGQ
jgi:hypothetical protein